MAPSIPPDGKIPCPSPRHLSEELDELAHALEPEEKEDTWERFERAIMRFAAVTRGGGYKHTDVYVEGIGRGGVGAKIIRCMLSDRGRLSGVATDFLQTLAPRLANQFKPLISLYLEPLLVLLGRPNKVILRRAEKCLTTIISHCPLPQLIPYLKTGLQDSASSCRKGCAAAVERALAEWDVTLWTERWVSVVEESLKRMAVDKDPDVRKTGKRVWGVFMDMWPERIDDFSAPLTPTIRRYLDIPQNGQAGPSRPKVKSAPPRKASALTASTTSESTKPQHARVQELATRQIVWRQPPQPVHEAGPSRKSPKKDDSSYPGALPHHDSSRPRVGALSTLPSRPAPAHSRTVSQDTHVSVHAASLDLYPQTHADTRAKLSKPVRPTLPTGWSTSALLPETSDAAKPRRLAPPERIKRPVSEEGDEMAHVNAPAPSASTGHGPLKGAVRLPNGKKATLGSGLGAAKRATSGHPGGMDVTGLEGGALRIKHNRDESAPQRYHQTESFFSPVPSKLPPPQQADSPLLPVLLRSTTSNHSCPPLPNTEVSEEMINLRDVVYPEEAVGHHGAKQMAFEEVQLAKEVELPLSPVTQMMDKEAPMTEKADQHLEDLELEICQPAELKQPEEIDDEATSASVVEAPSRRPSPSAPALAPAPVKAGPRPRVVSVAEPKSVVAAGPPRKPPVPKARVAKPAVPVVRKTFRPTPVSSSAVGEKDSEMAKAPEKNSKAVATVEKSDVVVSVASSAVGFVEKGLPHGPKGSKTQSRTVSATSTKTATSKAPATKAESRHDTKPRPPPATSKNASAPIPTAKQAAISRKPAVPSHVLPPIRKDKIRLKAPLPSFRPVRKGAPSVKPELLPLPVSPAKIPEEVALPPSPKDIALPQSPVPRSVPTPVLDGKEPSVSSPLRAQLARADSPARSVRSVRSVMSGSVPQSPIRVEKGKAASPVLSVAHGISGDYDREDDDLMLVKRVEKGEVEEAARIEGSEVEEPAVVTASEKGTDDKSDMSIDIDSQLISLAPSANSISDHTGIATAVTQLGSSTLSDDEYEQIEQEDEGMTLRTRARALPKVQEVMQQEQRETVEQEQIQTVQGERDLIEFSSPVRSNLSLDPPSNSKNTLTPSSPLLKPDTPAFATRTEISTPSKSAVSLLSNLDLHEPFSKSGGGGGAKEGDEERRVLGTKDVNMVGTPASIGTLGKATPRAVVGVMEDVGA